MSPRLLAAMSLAVSGPAFAWIYPEHRDIGNAGIARLEPESRAALQALWAEARPAVATPERLCVAAVLTDGDGAPGCLDFGALPALAGDHSCSPDDLASKVVPGAWVLGVARVGEETKRSLASATSHEDKLNRIARSNLALQKVDSEYATRAGANNAHFLLARAGNHLEPYVLDSIAGDAPLNAVGLYVAYHEAALARAQALARQPEAAASQRAALARDAVALEAYALHWLEDSFAAGHVVGTWGDTPWRKGTHDFYNEFGVDAVDWGGHHLTAHGDANLAKEDLERASASVAKSLEQLVAALTPGDPLAVVAQADGKGPDVLLGFDSCHETLQPGSSGASELLKAVRPQLETMPVPGRGEGEVHLPRMREELGFFLGTFASVAGTVNVISGSSEPNVNGTMAAGLRVGYGAESLTGSIGTGLLFAEVGLTMESAQLLSCQGDPECDRVGVAALFPRVPARSGLRLGLRLPFFLIPGDMLVLAPVLAFFAPNALSYVAIQAANGGLIPWQTSFQTRFGVLQLVLGRQVSATFYGLLSPVVAFAPIRAADGTEGLGFARASSLSLSFPVLEWTPFRTFATQLTYSTPIHLGFRLEIPLSYQVLIPENAKALPGPINWGVFVRLQFDARYFFGTREDLKKAR